METADCVILAAGDFPRAELPLQVLRLAKFVCCCDSAAQALIESGIREPDAIVGDGDSLPESYKQKYAHIFHQVSEQDDNDLTKATRYCIAKGFRRIDYLGTTGKREDHTLGNISLLLYYRRNLGIEPRMLTDHGIFITADGPTRISTHPGQQISIFNVSCTQLTGDGLRWQPYAYHELWQGTLNEATGSEVRFLADGEFLLFLNC